MYKVQRSTNFDCSKASIHRRLISLKDAQGPKFERFEGLNVQKVAEGQRRHRFKISKVRRLLLALRSSHPEQDTERSCYSYFVLVLTGHSPKQDTARSYYFLLVLTGSNHEQGTIRNYFSLVKLVIGCSTYQEAVQPHERRFNLAKLKTQNCQDLMGGCSNS